MELDDGKRAREIEAIARVAFRGEMRDAGVDVGRIPSDLTRQQDLLQRIDGLLARSDEFGRRKYHVERPGGNAETLLLTIDDALAPTRRRLLSRLMSNAAGSAATQLEDAIAKASTGAAGTSAVIREALGELNEVKRLADEQIDQDEVELLREERRAELKARMADRRRDRWFTRDSIAALAGALLLIGFAVVLIVMMFQGKQPSDIISNAFLLILGFFFGQGTRAGKGDG